MAKNNELERPNIDKSNGIINNLSDIQKEIDENNDEEQLQDYLEGITEVYKSGNPKIDEIAYKALCEKLNARLDQIKQDKITNKNVLEGLKKQNPNLNGLSVIETKKYDNDSVKDIEYIKYIDEAGNVKLLECYDTNAINNYLANHPDFAANGKAEELFNYFNQNVHREVKLETASQISREQEKINADLSNSNMNASETEKNQLEQEEMAKVKEYAINNNIKDEPQMGTDSRGERIYVTGPVVIKFKTNADNKRELYVISKSEYDENYENEEKVEVETAKDLTNAKEESKMPNEIAIIKVNEFGELFSKLYKGERLTPEETNKMHNFALNSINEMESGSIDPNDQNALDAYVEYLTEQKENGKTSPDDDLLIKNYQDKVNANNEKKFAEEAKAKENGEIKVLELKPIDHKGNIVSIVIIEVAVLLGILVTIIAIALK